MGQGKFTELSEQFAYETNYMASTIDPAAPESQPIFTLQDLVPSDPPKFDGTSKHVTTFCNQVRSMLRLASKRFSNPVQTVHYVANLLTGPMSGSLTTSTTMGTSRTGFEQFGC